MRRGMIAKEVWGGGVELSLCWEGAVVDLVKE